MTTGTEITATGAANKVFPLLRSGIVDKEALELARRFQRSEEKWLLGIRACAALKAYLIACGEPIEPGEDDWDDLARELAEENWGANLS